MEFKKEEAPNVVTEPRFRDLLTQGFVAEIVCQEDCSRRSGSWYGQWIMHVTDEDGRQERLLVKIPRHGHLDVEARVFKTVNGLVSFMLELGFETANIPLREGQRAINRMVSKDPETDRSNDA